GVASLMTPLLPWFRLRKPSAFLLTLGLCVAGSLPLFALAGTKPEPKKPGPTAEAKARPEKVLHALRPGRRTQGGGSQEESVNPQKANGKGPSVENGRKA